VLAGLETVRYRKNAITFRPGDEIYLYTDGVTEATDVHDALFGDDRLIETLNTGRHGDAKSLCDMVKESVDKFVGEADQFDDITMVGLRYFGPPTPEEPNASGEEA
jgi:sigma-B regulation protein RsbU (phosphoserine phosphatase)